MGFAQHEAESPPVWQAETPPRELAFLIRTKTPWKSAAFPEMVGVRRFALFLR
jgi:hypothetical protein